MIEVFPRRGYGGPVFEEDPSALAPRPVLPPKRGRPRKGEQAARVAQLWNQGNSWPSISVILNDEYGQVLTPDAYRKLCDSHKRNTYKFHRISLEEIFFQLARQQQPRTLRPAKRRGRPRKDAIRLEGRQMRLEGYTWRQIARTLNKKYNQALSVDAYQRLCRPAKHITPWRKLDLDLVRGLKSS